MEILGPSLPKRAEHREDILIGPPTAISLDTIRPVSESIITCTCGRAPEHFAKSQ